MTKAIFCAIASFWGLTALAALVLGVSALTQYEPGNSGMFFGVSLTVLSSLLATLSTGLFLRRSWIVLLHGWSLFCWLAVCFLPTLMLIHDLNSFVGWRLILWLTLVLVVPVAIQALLVKERRRGSFVRASLHPLISVGFFASSGLAATFLLFVFYISWSLSGIAAWM